MALLLALRELLWIKKFIKDLSHVHFVNNVIRENNQGAIVLVYNPEYHARTKYIDV